MKQAFKLAIGLLVTTVRIAVWPIAVQAHRPLDRSALRTDGRICRNTIQLHCNVREKCTLCAHELPLWLGNTLTVASVALLQHNGRTYPPFQIYPCQIN